jgi:UDP-N-acetyl-2-amino-2-deoxyglucuronate dehydrogenase
MKNFALIGAAGYIAPRHLQAIRDTGNTLVAALDPHDSVGILDQHFPEAHFFTEFERFDRHLEKLRRKSEENRVHYVSICSPNYLHDAHIRAALRVRAHAICEKPLVINPWNLNQLEELEQETGSRVYNVLQLRLHPGLIAIKTQLDSQYANHKAEVILTYITRRGKWYQTSWKGSMEKSGGVSTNIGIHFFDLLMWFFGKVEKHEAHLSQADKMAGYLELERARVRWFLSLDYQDLPETTQQKGGFAYRSMAVEGEEMEFSEGFTGLHTRVYEDILAGGGFGIAEARPSIQLTADIRNSDLTLNSKNLHPFLKD